MCFNSNDHFSSTMRYKVALVVKNSSANAGNTGDMGLDSWVKKIPPE